MQFTPLTWSQVLEKLQADGHITTYGLAAVNSTWVNKCTPGFCEIIYNYGYARGREDYRLGVLQTKADLLDTIIARIQLPPPKRSWWKRLLCTKTSSQTTSPSTPVTKPISTGTSGAG